MVALNLVYAVAYAAVSVTTVAALVVVWFRRAARDAFPLAGLMLGIAIWCGASAAMWYAPTFAQQVFWNRVQDLGVWTIPVAFLSLALMQAGVDARRLRAPVALVALTSFVLANAEWVNPGNLFDAGYTHRTIGPHTAYSMVPGPLYWVLIAFIYVTVLVAGAILFRSFRRASGPRRRRATVLLVGALVPLGVSIMTVAGFVRLDFDLTPLAFTVTGALWMVAILRGTLLETLPVAREMLVQQMSDGVVVVDSEGLVADANPAALSILGLSHAQTLGKPAETVIGRVEGAAALLDGEGDQRAVLAFGPEGEPRYMQFEVITLSGAEGTRSPRLVTLHEVTQQRLARLQEARLATIVTSSRDAIFTADLGGVVTSWNTGAEVIYGYTAHEMIGTSAVVLTAPGQEGAVQELVERVLAEGYISDFESQSKRKDGRIVDVSLSLSQIKDNEGKLVAVSVIGHDVTERRRIERERQESDAKLATAFKASPDSLVITRMHDDMILDTNVGFERMLGYTAAESIGRTTEGLTIWADAGDRDRFVSILSKDGLIDDFATTFRRKDGTIVPVSDSARVFRLGDEECILSVAHDLTTFNRAAAELREREEELAKAQSVAHLGSWSWSIPDDHMTWSDETYRIYGVDPADFGGNMAAVVELIHPDDRAHGQEIVAKVLEGAEVGSFENRIVRPDGEVRWVTIRGASVERDATGQPLRFSGTVMDVTELMQERAALIASEAGLRESNLRFRGLVHGVVEAMGRIVDARDPYTQGHEVRVAALAKSIAEGMHLLEDDVQAIEMAGLLHDIGKLGVPVEILAKPGRLSSIEFELVKEHSRAGYEMLKGIDFPGSVAAIVLSHHERMDGSGYPNGIAGDEIILGARIIGVADVIEAMSSHRPYRSALGLQAAVSELGDHPERYDPEVVSAYMALYASGRGDPATLAVS